MSVHPLSVCLSLHLSTYLSVSVHLSISLSVCLSLHIFLLSVQESDVTYVLCSGLSGENLVRQPPTEELLKWYRGNTLLEEIDLMEPPSRLVDRPLRCSVMDIFKGGVERTVCEACDGCGLGCVSLYPELCSGWTCG